MTHTAAVDGTQVWAYSLPPSESGGAGGGAGRSEGGRATNEGSREAGLLRVPYALELFGGAPSAGLIILTTLGLLLVRGWRWSNCPLSEGGCGKEREEG